MMRLARLPWPWARGVVAALAPRRPRLPLGGGAGRRGARPQVPVRQAPDKDGAIWTLKKSCTTKKTIEIPDGVFLDGNGKTIKLTGLSTNYTNGEGIVANGPDANIEDLKVDNRTLCGAGSLAFMIAFHNTSGEIRDVELTNSQPARCSEGAILVSGTQELATDIRFSSVEGAIVYRGDGNPADPPQVSGTIANVVVSTTEFFVAITIDRADVDVIHTTVEGAAQGIEVKQGSSATISNNTLQRVSSGVGVSVDMPADVTNNTIVGLGDEHFGVPTGIAHGGSGSITGNTISNYLDPGPGIGCGIFLSADSTVDLGTNTFPNPPGNEQDECDFRLP